MGWLIWCCARRFSEKELVHNAQIWKMKYEILSVMI
jgi:hypothetical protein